jgi:hypothetical protein
LLYFYRQSVTLKSCYPVNFKFHEAFKLAPIERMDLHFGQCLERPDGICSIASVPGCDVTSEMDMKKDNGNSVLTKEERIEKVIGICFALHSLPHHRARIRLTNHSDRSLCFSKIEFLPYSVLPVACGLFTGSIHESSS